MARWRMFDKLTTISSSFQRQRAMAAMNKLLSTTVWLPIDQNMTNIAAESFFIPSDETDAALAGNSLSALFAAFGFRYCNALFPKHSWPWTIARESVFVLANQTTYTESELQRIYESEDTGPIGCLVIAELLAKLNSSSAGTFAIGGLTRLGSAHFQNECRVLLEGQSGLARAFSNMASALREMPVEELEALAALLPPDESTFLKDCARNLRAAPNEPLSTSLRSALDAYWENSLRARVRQLLLKLSSSPSEQPASKSSSAGA
jgi:hypothetical protein